MRRIRADISPVDGARRFRDLGVDVFLGEGKLTGPDTLEVGRARLRFRRAVIATGARAVAPPVPGLEEAGYLTNETVFSLKERPRRLAVIGAGPVGCELGQAFARLGSEVTIFEKTDHVLPREDPDASAVLEESMRRDGVNLILESDIRQVEVKGDHKVLVHGSETAVDEILVGAGRAPNVEGIGLEAAGVEFDGSGVKVDDFLRTTNPRIYAAGDVASRFRFTHAADSMARAVVRNALFLGRARLSRLIIPWCTYTSPEVAHVGAYADGPSETITVPMKEVDRAVIDGEAEGFFRVHLRKGTDEILGATLVAENAGDMIGEIALAMTANIGLSQIGKTIHPYPTRTEVFRKAADARNRDRLTPRIRKILSLWFRIFA
jgi:pyruvate/2-oxoglutarate dehydrogenase complex dihydrolipoamide dehydrogenase (E3) component